jgi:Actin
MQRCPLDVTDRQYFHGTAVTAVHDGFALEKSTVRSPLGGALLNRAMAASVQKKGVLIRPRLSFRRVERAPGVWEVPLSTRVSDRCVPRCTCVSH